MRNLRLMVPRVQTGSTFPPDLPKRTCRRHPPRAQQPHRPPWSHYRHQSRTHLPKQHLLKPAHKNRPPLKPWPVTGCSSLLCPRPKPNPPPLNQSHLPTAQPNRRYHPKPPTANRLKRLPRPIHKLQPKAKPLKNQQTNRPSPQPRHHLQPTPPRQTQTRQTQTRLHNSYSKALSSRATRFTAATACRVLLLNKCLRSRTCPTYKVPHKPWPTVTRKTVSWPGWICCRRT